MKIYILFIFILLLGEDCFSAPCPTTITQGETVSCDLITQHGITWTFSANETVGQFITGDYFVVNDGSVVVSASPNSCDAVTCRHGSMVNPIASGTQGHDSRLYSFSLAETVAFPYIMQSNDSLMSTVSWEDSNYHTSITGDKVQSTHGFLRSAAVLTCVGTAPPANSFRPGFSGTEKTLYNISDVRTGLLNSFPILADLERSTAENAIPTYADIYKRPWLHYGPDWQGRALHPTDNMPNYYRESFGFDSEAIMLTHSSDPSKNQLLYNFLQRGIDMASTVKTKTGMADRMISKSVLVFTGIMLGDDTISSLTNGREISQVYYGTGWAGQTTLWRDKIGLEYEHVPPSQWKDTVVSAGCGCKAEAYRRDSHSWNWVGSALGIRLMGNSAMLAYNKPEFFDYIDRWMTEENREPEILSECSLSQTKDGAQPQCTSYSDYPDSGLTSSPFILNMWSTYRNYNASRRLSLGGRPIKLAEPGP